MELADRHTAGLDVVLLWDEGKNTCTVEVTMDKETVRGLVPNELAMDAFIHPGVYLRDMHDLLDRFRLAVGNPLDYGNNTGHSVAVVDEDDEEDVPFA